MIFQPVEYKLGPFPPAEKGKGEQAFFLSFFFRFVICVGIAASRKGEWKDRYPRHAGRKAQYTRQTRPAPSQEKTQAHSRAGDLPAPPSNRIIGRIVSDDSVRQKALEVQRAAQAQKKKEEQEAFLTAYRDSFALPHIAAKKCRISVTKHNQWFSTDMDYRRRAEEIKEFCAEHLQAKMYKSALAGDGQMLRYLDQRRIAAEQSAALKIAVEHSGTVGCSFTSEEDMKEKTGFTVRRMEHTLKMLADYAPEALRQILVAPNEIPDKAPDLRKMGRKPSERRKSL